MDACSIPSSRTRKCCNVTIHWHIWVWGLESGVSRSWKGLAFRPIMSVWTLETAPPLSYWKHNPAHTLLLTLFLILCMPQILRHDVALPPPFSTPSPVQATMSPFGTFLEVLAREHDGIDSIPLLAACLSLLRSREGIHTDGVLWRAGESSKVSFDQLPPLVCGVSFLSHLLCICSTKPAKLQKVLAKCSHMKRWFRNRWWAPPPSVQDLFGNDRLELRLELTN